MEDLLTRIVSRMIEFTKVCDEKKIRELKGTEISLIFNLLIFYPRLDHRWRHVLQSQATDSHNDLLQRRHRGDLHLNRRCGGANKIEAESATPITKGREKTP